MVILVWCTGSLKGLWFKNLNWLSREMPGPFGLKIMGPNGPGDCLTR